MPSFAELAAAFLAEEYADSPVLASHLGVEGHDDRLDDLSETAFAARRRRSAEWLARFEAVPETGLASEERIDRELIRSVLRGRAIMADWEMWRRQPDIYLGPGLSGVFILFLHRRRPERDLVRAAVARLAAVPEGLAAGERNLQPDLTPAVYVERALGQVRAGARYARELVPAEVAEPRLRAELAEAGARAASAYDRFALFLEGLRARASGAWAIGEERYTRLLREKELLSDDARALRARGRREYERLAEELGHYALTIAGTDDWPASSRS